MATVVDDRVFRGKIAFESWAQGGNVLHHCSLSLPKKRPVDLKKNFNSTTSDSYVPLVLDWVPLAL